jgi:mRNA-degrading endonuclease RelE of RelBE toxin-antitoxin system
MNFKIIPTPQFVKSVKKLSKKYKQIKNDLQDLQKELVDGTDSSIELGNGCYKLRLKNSSIPTGKRGGFRVIYYTKIKEKIYLLEIYSKSDIENIDDKMII